MDVDEIVEAVRPILAGNPPQIVGAALADLLAIFLASHIVPGRAEATDRIRKELLATHLDTVRALIPVNEAAIMLGRPAGE
jgi:hypothetical protein